jgi:serine-type D-Ala-D-Ala carboxypeptidase/endopeptidase (penicillin-binding protein 4)
MRFVLSFLLALSLIQSSLAAGLPPELEAMVRRLAPRTSIAVREISAAAPSANALSDRQWIVDVNADEPMNPASTMKILSTYAALSLLKPGYRFTTPVFLRGKLADGVLQGDLVWRGGGDPKFVIEDLTEFIAQLRAKGLQEIRGDLVIDDSLYLLAGEGLDTIDGDVSQPYNVAPYSAVMNFKATKFVITPTGDGRVQVSLDPALADVQVQNHIKLVRGPCRFGAGGLAIRDDAPASADKGRPTITLAGQYSATCGEQNTYAAVLDHRQFIHGFFKAAWLASGGVFTGTTKVQSGAANGLPQFATWTAPRTVSDLVRDANKFSNNLVTRQLLLQTAYEVYRLPASVDRARSVLQSFLKQKQIPAPGFVVDNGSGLSRQERITAKSLALVLDSAMRSEVAQEMVSSLPQVGVDGTMKNRLLQDAVAGRAWIKTGSLRDVRAIAGYLQAQSGKWYAVVMMSNGDGIGGTAPVQDKLLSWLYAAG